MKRSLFSLCEMLTNSDDVSSKTEILFDNYVRDRTVCESYTVIDRVLLNNSDRTIIEGEMILKEITNKLKNF